MNTKAKTPVAATKKKTSRPAPQGGNAEQTKVTNATKPADNSATDTLKGKAMATQAPVPNESLEDIEAQIKKLQAAHAAKLNAERKPALEAVLSQIKRYNFTAKELGFNAASAPVSASTDGAAAGSSKTVLLSYKPNLLGKATTFSKGDKLATPQKAFRELYEKDKANFAESLKATYKPGAAEYFETDAGKQELAYFIQQTTRDVGKRKA